jgi:D-alanyl-D-alanine endopeptidase (penicillin-binding protein 7)
MKSSKFTLNAFPGLSRRVLSGALRRTILPIAISVALGAAFGVPTFAVAASASATPASAHGKGKHNRHDVVAKKVAQSTRNGAVHASSSVHGRHMVRTGAIRTAAANEVPRGSRHARRHGVLHQVAFAPTARAFNMQEMHDGPALRSSVAYVIDENTSSPLIDKNSSAVVPIASISKLMTAMVTLDAKLPLDDMMMVTDEDRDYEKGSGSRLSVGSKLSREDMLHIALMSSENRAAAALSRYYPGGRPAFMVAMNKKAHDLGMLDTHFDDPTGLNFHNVSSAHDLVKMVEAAYKYPLIRQFSTAQSYEVNTGRARLQYNSSNALVHSAAWDIGLQKTGFINEAGECMVMQTTIQSRPVVIVLLDSVGKYSRVADAQRVRSWLIQTGAIERLTQADTHHAGA